MTDHPSEIIWIKEHLEHLNLKAVAKSIGVEPKALWNYCHGRHSLNEKWWAPAKKWVRGFTQMAAPTESIIYKENPKWAANGTTVGTSKASKTVGKMAGNTLSPMVKKSSTVGQKQYVESAYMKQRRQSKMSGKKE